MIGVIPEETMDTLDMQRIVSILGRLPGIVLRTASEIQTAEHQDRDLLYYMVCTQISCLQNPKSAESGNGPRHRVKANSPAGAGGKF